MREALGPAQTQVLIDKEGVCWCTQVIIRYQGALKGVRGVWTIYCTTVFCYCISGAFEVWHPHLVMEIDSLEPWRSCQQLGVVVSICHQHASPRKVCHPIPLWYWLHGYSKLCDYTARIVAVFWPICVIETACYVYLCVLIDTLTL